MTPWVMTGGYQVPETVMRERGGKHSPAAGLILFLATNPCLLVAMSFHIIWKRQWMAAPMGRTVCKADRSSDLVVRVLVVFL